MNIVGQSKLFARVKTGTWGTSQEGFAIPPQVRAGAWTRNGSEDGETEPDGQLFGMDNWKI